MQTQCVRCQKAIDTVQGYKFSATEYVCMSCYDEFKAERAAKAKKQKKNSLLDRYGAEGQAQAPQAAPQPQPTAPSPQQAPAPPQPQQAPPPAQPAARPAPEQQMFAPRSAPTTPAPGPSALEPVTPQVGGLKAAAPEPSAPGPVAPGPAALEPSAPKPRPSAESCDVCQKPISDFKIPLKGGRKVCMGCNDILREVAKSLVLNVQCPHCGKDVQVAEE
jgi:DNA-directed RNA polymerase subunit RPC12/RpoP